MKKQFHDGVVGSGIVFFVILIVFGQLQALRAAEFPLMHPADLVIGPQIEASGLMVKPSAIVHDRLREKVYVVDPANHRILRFSREEAMRRGGIAEAVLGQPNFDSVEPGTSEARFSECSGAAIDSSGRLWVADTGNNRVLRFDEAWTADSGAEANAVLGQVNFTDDQSGYAANRMNSPRAVLLGPYNELYVADTGNHRVLRFTNPRLKANGANADIALGQSTLGALPASGTSSTRMSEPMGMAWDGIDRLDRYWLWVADSANNRVLRFENPQSASTGTGAAAVLGQAAFNTRAEGSAANRLAAPVSVTVRDGVLWICERMNHRVVWHKAAVGKANGSAADGVLGQPAFNSNSSGQGTNRLGYPQAVAMDSTGSLWVGDTDGRRVLRFDQALTKVNGADADGLMGSQSFTHDPKKVFSASGIALDPVTGKVFVSDCNRHRVLRFAQYTGLEDDSEAEAVFGQANFTGEEPGTGNARMEFPLGITVDASGCLWVADSGNNRVLGFNSAGTRTSGVGADYLFGQANFNTKLTGLSSSRMNYPCGVATDPTGRLWVADAGNFRVLRYDNAASKGLGAPANGVLGKPNFTTAGSIDDSPENNVTGMVVGLHVDAAGRLWVCDTTNNRVLRFDQAASKANGAAADRVLGQAGFFANEASATAGGMNFPTSAAVDAMGRLWVGDLENSRLLCFPNAAGLANGAAASFQLGQTDWGLAEGADIPDRRRPHPISFFHAPDRSIWVSDFFSDAFGRILRFSPAADNLRLVRSGINAQRRFYLTFESVPQMPYQIETSTDLVNWQVVDHIFALGPETTWTASQTVSGRRFYRVSIPGI